MRTDEINDGKKTKVIKLGERRKKVTEKYLKHSAVQQNK